MVESLVRHAAFCLLDTMRGLNILRVAMLATLSRQTAGSLSFVLVMFGEPVGKTCLSGYQNPDNSS